MREVAGKFMLSGSAIDPVRLVACQASKNGETLTWFGRLDNGPELASTLGLQSSLDFSPIRPGPLILNVYRKWGTIGLGRLIGDWSLVIESAEATILASDYAGSQPLYHRMESGQVIWSRRLSELVPRTLCSSELDLNFFSDYVCQGASSRGTPFRGIARVPPGHAITIRQAASTMLRLWNPPCEQDIHVRDPADYSSRLFDLFAKSVSARLPEDGTALVELSGGLDSSSVTCMAAHQRETWGPGSRNLVTISYDERDSKDKCFLQAVENKWDLPRIHIPIEDCLPQLPDLSIATQPEFWQTRFRQIRMVGQSYDARTLLTGQLGDLMMGNWIDDHEQVGDCLQRGEFKNALVSAMAWGGALARPIYPILWRGIRSAMFPAGDLAPPEALNSGILSASARRNVEEFERRRWRGQSWTGAPPSLRKRIAALLGILESGKLGTPDSLAPMTIAHPFADRRLVEFMLRVPAGIVCGPGQPRRLMRAAFSSLLPNAVARRRSKASYSQSYRRALKPLVSALTTKSLALADLGIVDPKHFGALLERFELGTDEDDQSLRHAVLAELWITGRLAK